MQDQHTPPSNSSLPLLISSLWTDYELVDSGDGLKLERYGPYQFIRPEPQAMWSPALNEKHWRSAHGIFKPSREESGGHWVFNRPVDEAWTMSYRELRFQAQATGGRHLGVFPEQAAQWDWIQDQIRKAIKPPNVLTLFGYTGLASLAAAQAGAQVTHVDASKKALRWARHNQNLSGLNDRPIRWLLDDAMKFVQREARRGVKYDGMILDPPKFGRGPKGEVWEFFELFPKLLKSCVAILGPTPLFFVITAYAIRASALALQYALQEIMAAYQGNVSSGELVLGETSAGRMISAAIFSRWSKAD